VSSVVRLQDALSLITRLLLWFAFLGAAAVVAFFAGYLIGPHV
jgi:hypothetical protein